MAEHEYKKNGVHVVLEVPDGFWQRTWEPWWLRSIIYVFVGATVVHAVVAVWGLF
jgi:hypothetical protein